MIQIKGYRTGTCDLWWRAERSPPMDRDGLMIAVDLSGCFFGESAKIALFDSVNRESTGWIYQKGEDLYVDIPKLKKQAWFVDSMDPGKHFRMSRKFKGKMLTSTPSIEQVSERRIEGLAVGNRAATTVWHLTVMAMNLKRAKKRGLSFLRAVEIVADKKPDVDVGKFVKRLNDQKAVVKPKEIGRDEMHKQRKLYEPTELLEYAARVLNLPDDLQPILLKEFKANAQWPRDNKKAR